MGVNFKAQENECIQIKRYPTIGPRYSHESGLQTYYPNKTEQRLKFISSNLDVKFFRGMSHRPPSTWEGRLLILLRPLWRARLQWNPEKIVTPLLGFIARFKFGWQSRNPQAYAVFFL